MVGVVMPCDTAQSSGSALGVRVRVSRCYLDLLSGGHAALSSTEYMWALTHNSAHAGLSPINVGRMLMRGVLPTYSPCPALACIELLKRSDIPIHNKKVGHCAHACESYHCAAQCEHHCCCGGHRLSVPVHPQIAYYCACQNRCRLW
jgi:hypothetical protein